MVHPFLLRVMNIGVDQADEVAENKAFPVTEPGPRQDEGRQVRIGHVHGNAGRNKGWRGTGA